MRRLLPVLACLAALSGCADRAPAASGPVAPPVYAEQVSTHPLVPTSTATAEILAKRQSNLRAEVAGRVIAVNAEVGQRVEAGDVLIKLDVGRTTSAVQAAQASVAEAQARLEQATRERARTETLVKQGSLAQQQLDDAQDAVRLAQAARNAARAQAKLTRRGLTDAAIRAPFGGTVVERRVEVGEYLAPGSPLLTLADPSELKALVLLDPREALDVAVGAAVRAGVHARPGEAFTGTVVRVGDVIDPRTRRLPVEIDLDESDRLRPGLVARFEVDTGAERPAILIPLKAVFERFGRQHVYVITEGVAERRVVTLGLVREGAAEITSGLSVGDQVVVDGVARVVDGSAVRVVEPNTAQRVEP